MAKRGSKAPTIKLLLENFVFIQKVLADVSTDLTKLNQQLASLLGLFEQAAKNFVEVEKVSGKVESSKANELLGKLDTLLEQNRTIAKGLTLIEQKLREQTEVPPAFSPKPLPEFRF